VDQYLNRWLKDAAEGSLRNRTFENYKDVLERYIRPQVGPVKLSKLTPLEIQGAYNKMRADGLSARTVRYTHAVLRSSVNQAVKWQILYRNPADYVDLPRNEKKEMRALTVEQVGKFLKAAETSGTCACNPKRGMSAKAEKQELNPCRYTSLFGLAITSGLRPGEYLDLQWPDIDLDRGTVMVRRALVPDSEGGWTFAEPKTKQSLRTVPASSLAQGHPLSELFTAFKISFTVTVPSNVPSPAMQSDTGRLPSAIFTITRSSSTVTA